MKADIVIDRVRKLAREHPDAVYKHDTCLYTKGECGPGVGCIIGQALPEYQEELWRLDNITDFHVSSMIRELNIEVTEEQSIWLETVQHYQDKGVTWEKAVKEAEGVEKFRLKSQLKT